MAPLALCLLAEVRDGFGASPDLLLGAVFALNSSSVLKKAVAAGATICTGCKPVPQINKLRAWALIPATDTIRRRLRS